MNVRHKINKSAIMLISKVNDMDRSNDGNDEIHFGWTSFWHILQMNSGAWMFVLLMSDNFIYFIHTPTRIHIKLIKFSQTIWIHSFRHTGSFFVCIRVQFSLSAGDFFCSHWLRKPIQSIPSRWLLFYTSFEQCVCFFVVCCFDRCKVIKMSYLLFEQSFYNHNIFGLIFSKISCTIIHKFITKDFM